DFPQHSEHLVVDPAVARDHRGRVEIHGIAHQIRDPAAGLLDEEASGGDVPRSEAELPEAVESTGGDPREIEDGGAESTHAAAAKRRLRSEEHTSELQSRGHLVCRLLLEKKNARTTWFRGA